MSVIDQLTRRLGQAPVNVSRRGFLAGSGALVLATALPLRPLRGQEAAAEGPAVTAFLELRSDGTALLRSPFIEGGQGIFTAMAQIVGEELDLAPENFSVEIAPAGGPFAIMGGYRLTGGSMSTRTGYPVMRQLGAAARAMLVEAAAQDWGVDASELVTEPGIVVHEGSGRRVAYGDLAAAAMDLPVPAEPTLKDPADFRWIGTALPRMDVRAKSTGRQTYAIDVEVEGMLLAALRHAPRLGLTPAAVTNQAEIEAMRGVHSVQMLDGAVAVVAEKFWQARRAIDAAEIDWTEGEARWPMPADFSSVGFRDTLAGATGEVVEVEASGDAAGVLEAAETMIEATYDAPYVAHGQLEPPSATARFNEDGTLDLWMPCQAPEMFVGAAAAAAGLDASQINLHQQVLGGFFGRHFLYATANPFPQAIALAKAVGRPVKLIWTREEDFLRDAPRPLGLARFRGAVGPDGPTALQVEVVGEGPTQRWYQAPPGQDPSATEGISGKTYAIANKHIGQIYHANPAVIGYWRAVGHSMHDFMYESFLDELAQAGGLDPFEMRLSLLSSSERHRKLLERVGELSGGWRPGPFEAEEGTTRARGVAMASPFGSEAAVIAEVSVDGGEVRVHQVWVALDPGQVVNPSTVEAQVQSAVALGTSQTLVEELVYENGEPTARNFDMYPILRPDQMPQVHTAIVESGAPMGGVGEPGLPAVGPAIVNAVATLTGQRIRSLPLSKHDFG
ncbi:xanthine dehydrogenase family protein molybdopterin-binding subunit [Pseudooceanicola nanhaiensis]|uniref:xanthine dehydrogenase family protein molybdopterin-binding subunit n=1 Tax=Pseudooceanicola nanhaiensis TaxID=375761 RepID=UPI001CD63D93|nr:xanthine dehydrogenase family protein molybdopterin-binding subunit [Pseudooceanicola nanhaiensis]MCA0919293.1 xanthine dehydrogenase family protein molybdopterin-binding subunit [Pseudooceanicola nanhaiensis]